VFTIFYVVIGLLTLYAIMNARIQGVMNAIEARMIGWLRKNDSVHEITIQIVSVLYFTVCLTLFTVIGAAIFRR